MGVSARGVTTGLAGSLAVLLIAAVSLAVAHARNTAHATPVVQGGSINQPTPADFKSGDKPWVNRLLSRSRLEAEHAPS